MESLGRVSVSNASFSDTILTQKCSNDVVALFIKGKHYSVASEKHGQQASHHW